jgi:hypothetical protein
MAQTESLRPRRRRRGGPRYIAAVLVITLVAPATVTIVRCALATRAPQAADEEDPADVRQAKAGVHGYARPEAATFFTLPEWLILYDAEEYAAHVTRARPSAFPYFRSIPRYWRYDQGLCDTACGRYPFDSGDHLMLAIIGTSASVENLLKGLYESSIGRVTEWLATTDTAEDRHAAAVAADYARFMHAVPWYDYPFGRAFGRVWSETGLWGPHPLRKWERKFALSLEYGIKAVYGSIIRFGSKSVYGDEDEWIAARVESLPADAFADPRIRHITTLADGSSLVSIKRYEPFTAVVSALAGRGARFRDVAGNHRMVMTAIGLDAPVFAVPDARVLFAIDQLTSDRKRFVIEARLDAIGTVLGGLTRAGLTLEHLYDY